MLAADAATSPNLTLIGRVYHGGRTKYVKKIRLPVILTTGEDGYIVASVPVIPGCISQGRTIEEALANIKEAADLCLEGRNEEGWDVPEEVRVAEIEVLV
jgi:predicted RNase H-like HicB family nuclease